MHHPRLLGAIGISLVLLCGCAGDSEHARHISHSEARTECRQLTDASAYLECKKRADAMHARR